MKAVDATELSGHVVDGKDTPSPITGAFVTIVEPLFSGLEWAVRTNDDGAYLIKGVPAQTRCTITVSCPGYFTYRGPSKRIIAGANNVEDNIVMQHLSIVTGGIRNEEGVAIEGVQVTVRESPSGFVLPPKSIAGRSALRSKSTTTDRTGNYSIEHDFDRCSIETVCDGYGDQVLEFDEYPRGSTTRVDFELSAAREIAGHVVDGDGNPVQDASIEISTDPDVPGAFATSAISDRDGGFRVPRVGRGKYGLEVVKSGFSKRVALCEAGDTDIRLVLLGPGCLRGRLDRNMNETITGVYVALHRTSTESVADSQSSDFRKATLNDRWITVSDIPPGEYDAVVGCNGYAPHRLGVIKIVSDSVVDVGMIPLDLGAEIDGRVLLESGSPVSNASVVAMVPEVGTMFHEGANLFIRATSTDGNGAFRITGVAPGATSIRVLFKDYCTREDMRFHAVADERMDAGDIVLVRSASISGCVVGNDGAGVPGARVAVRDRRIEQVVFADSSGCFLANGIWLGGIAITASDKGGRRRSVSMELHLEQAGQTVEVRVPIR